MLVDDDGHLLLGLLELLEQVGHLHGFRDEEDRPDEGLDGLALVLLVGVREDVLGHDDALDVVDPVLVDGDARVFLRDDEVLELLDGGVLPDADHVDPGGHDLADDGVAELDDAPQELVLALLDDALLPGLVDEGLDLLVGRLALLVLVLPLLALDEVPGEEEDRGAEGAEQPGGGRKALKTAFLPAEVEEPGQVVEEDGRDAGGDEEKPERPEPRARGRRRQIDQEGDEEDRPAGTRRRSGCRRNP